MRLIKHKTLKELHRRIRALEEKLKNKCACDYKNGKLVDPCKQHAELVEALEDAIELAIEVDDFDWCNDNGFYREWVDRIQGYKQSLPEAGWKEVCDKCGNKLELSAGWIPSYNDPDNVGMALNVEPYCPKCEQDKGGLG